MKLLHHTISNENEQFEETEQLEAVRSVSPTPPHHQGFSESEIIFAKLAAQINAREGVKNIPKLEIIK